VPGKEWAAHIRSAGGRPGDIAAFFSDLPRRLEADDAVRDEENRRDHLVRLGQARQRLRAARTATSASLPWTLRQPLVPGDRLVWRDEGLREMEIGRWHPSPDQEFSLRCEDRVVEGDRIRWVMEPEGLLDDRPQVEARVERIEPVPGKGGGDVAVLTVIRSWGLDDPPEPGSEIRQTMAALMERSCVRQHRDDEDVRAAKLAEAHERIRAYRPGPSWGFRM